MRSRSLIAVALVAVLLLCGCAGNHEENIVTAAESTAVETEATETTATIATEPSTLPPSRPPEEVLPEIETLVADMPNARAYIEDGTLCVETCDEITTGTGSIAYDRLDGGADAWQKVIDNNIALCLLIRTRMDDKSVTDTPAKVVLTDCRFSRPILTVVDGKVTEDTVSIELAKATTVLPNAPFGSNGKAKTGSGGQGTMVWISEHGSRYHSRSNCSNMQNPYQVTRDEALLQGREACKKCYG